MNKTTTGIFSNLKVPRVEKLSDKIINQIRELIESGRLHKGDRLPAERKLAELFGVSRMHVRDALQKLEVLGVLETYPQSGTIIKGFETDRLSQLLKEISGLYGIKYSENIKANDDSLDVKLKLESDK